MAEALILALSFAARASGGFSGRSPAADEGDDFNAITVDQPVVVSVAAAEAFVDLDGDLPRLEAGLCQ